MSLTKATYSLIKGAPANVLDFGADASGTSDSAPAFQAALDSGAEKVMTTSQYLPTTAPASPSAGQVYYDSGTNKLRCYNGSTWNDLF